MNKPVYRFLSFMAAFALTIGGHTRVLASSPAESALQISNTYYVSTNGSDTNTGTQAAPFKTFAKATSILVPGDVLQVVTGTYLETLNLAASGTATAPITVMGNGSVLNMQGINANGITINGSYIRVAGFEVTGATEFGIFIKGKYVTVENNNVHDAVTINGVGTCGTSASWGSAIKVGVGGENTTIRNNIVYNNCGEGISVTRGVNVLVEKNTTYDNFGVNIYIDNSPYTTVQNNISYCTGTHLRNGNRASGIALGEELYPGWGAQLHAIVVSGNTIRDCQYGISAYESDAAGTLTDVNIINNNVPSGQERSISLQTLANQNVVVSYNTLFNAVYAYQSAGVTFFSNVIGNVTTTFADVPIDYWAMQSIESIYRQGITSGCINAPVRYYCPNNNVTRAEMAVFLLKSKHTSSYVPPAATGVFQDVPTNDWAAAWIEQLAAEGITSGCSVNPKKYCPTAPVTRDQMAIFLLRAKYGSDYVPSKATGVFQDVPVNYWAADWIEQFKAEGITTGCGNGNYCPNKSVTRAEMAVFLQSAFDLPLP